MTEVEWPDVRSIKSFQTFIPNDSKLMEEFNDNSRYDNEVNEMSDKRPKLPPKLRKVNPVMDPKISSTTDKLMPPLVPVRTVFPNELNPVGAVTRQLPTKLIPVNLTPISSIFDHVNGSEANSPDLSDKNDDYDDLEEDRSSANEGPEEEEPVEDEPISESDFEEEDKSKEIVFDLVISMDDDDTRFGFSLIGGIDEGFIPRIDVINAGSPADKTDLEVGDEILEVNGKSLEDATHTEVISHIHQCIRSRTISLRVKRKLGNKLVLDIAQNSNVQDAFVIAVEQQARDRLEKLSALEKIKPVDMTKLSHELNDSTCVENHDGVNGIIDQNSIFVVANTELGDGQSGNLSSQRSEKSVNTTEEEIELKVDKSENGFVVQPLELFESQSSFNMDNRPHREMAVDVPDTFVATAKQSPRYPPPRLNGSARNSRPQSEYMGSERSSRTSKDNDSIIKGSHTPSSSIDSSASSYKKPFLSPKPKFDDGNKVSQNNVHVNGDSGRDVDIVNDPGQLDRIKRYQEDIKKRKEEEERMAKEEEFLRSSLRGSKKLQALESNPAPVPPSGVINSAFLSDDAEEHEDSDRSTLNLSYVPQSSPVGPEDLQDALERVQMGLRNNGYHDDLSRVNNLLNNPEFQQSLLIHKKVQEIWCFKTPPTPLCTDAQDLVQEVLNILQECSLDEASELIDILSQFEVEGLFLAHDKVAERSMVAAEQGDEDILERASQYTDDSIKIVRIDKTNEPLGATVRNEGEAVIIGRIVKGGAAEKSGLLHEGDEILEVNEIEMRGKSVNDVCDILATMTGTLTFIIIPTQNERPRTPVRDTVMHVKAHFDYEPDDDLYNPCRELGISFQKGDILHVINQEDANWWQAYREGEEDQTLAGLIPSKNFQNQRESTKQTIVGDNNKEKTKKSKFLCARRPHRKKKKKVMYNAYYNEEAENEEILTYEEVALYYPRANRKRPIVLIGPPNIGRHELRQKLMEDVDRFAAAIPHTSRLKKDGELDGQDYHFITRSQFEADIISRKFVEHGEFEKNYYGTSINAIRSIINSCKICVLNLHPQSLKILKNSDLKPYVVFVAPPSLEKLRQNRAKMSANVKDEELKDIIEKAREMEDSYGHYFDMIIINSDINKAYHELLKEINILEREPQWVPAVWLDNDIN